MQTLTDLDQKLLEIREMRSQLETKKKALIESKSELEKQIVQVLQKQSEIEKFMEKVRQTEVELERQIERQSNSNRSPQPISPPASQTTFGNPLPDLKALPHAAKTNPIAGPTNKKLQSELLTLLSGNVGTANRLLKHQQNVNPGQPANWYLEKVIADLKRDRH